MNTPFHLSLPCLHIAATEKFYVHIIGATQGRKAQKWLDINLFGHQITFTNSGHFKFEYPSYSFEKTVLPAFHFGIILPSSEWKSMYKRMQKEDFLFIDETRFLNEKAGEHQSFFLRDPNGYILEFKCFKEPDSVFVS